MPIHAFPDHVARDKPKRCASLAPVLPAGNEVAAPGPRGLHSVATGTACTSMRNLVSTGILATLALSAQLAIAAGYKTELTVGSNDAEYSTIQAAIDDAKSFPDLPITIRIAPGTYREKILVPSWNNRLTLVGEGEVVITYSDHFRSIDRGRNSTFFTHTLRIDADDVTLRNLTIENAAGPVGQAVALHVEGNRCRFENLRILGHQDTLYVDGESAFQHFKDCYIEGTTDFIFGGASAVFDQCEIRAKSDSYLTAASTPKGAAFGFVFRDCVLSADEGVKSVYLGRPWRTHAQTVFIRCQMGPHIRPEGWHNWSNPDAETLSLYGEYKNVGPGADTSKRAPWSHQLTEQQAQQLEAKIAERLE